MRVSLDAHRPRLDDGGGERGGPHALQPHSRRVAARLVSRARHRGRRCAALRVRRRQTRGYWGRCHRRRPKGAAQMTRVTRGTGKDIGQGQGQPGAGRAAATASCDPQRLTFDPGHYAPDGPRTGERCERGWANEARRVADAETQRSSCPAACPTLPNHTISRNAAIRRPRNPRRQGPGRVGGRGTHTWPKRETEMLPLRRSRAGSRATDMATGAAGGKGVEAKGGEHDAVVGRDERSSSRSCSCARRALSSSTFWNICMCGGKPSGYIREEVAAQVGVGDVLAR